MNISKLSRQLDTEPQILREKLPSLGFDIGVRAIQVDDALVDKIIESWQMYTKRQKLKEKLAKRKKASPKKNPKIQKKDEKIIALPPAITVSEFAKRLNIDVSKVIIILMQEGVMAAINQKIDFETASIIAEDMGLQTKLSSDETETQTKGTDALTKILSKEKDLVERPPVVVVMGHVDHGKTSLLDAIRKTNVVDTESGAITQHIGAYQIIIDEPVEYKGKIITFIDTPGHEAFRGMRSRGGRVADIAVLVIAADDKIQPQTLESIEIIQKEGLSMIVAINKIDKPTSDVDRIKKQLSELNLTPEDWGGDIICVPISAKQNKNINQLLENILIVSEVESLKANPNGELYGTIIEAHVDKGLGPVATAIIQNGTLTTGDIIICGESGGRVKALHNYKGKTVKQITPGTPAKILGLKCMPQAGDIIERAASIKDIKKISKRYRINKQEVQSKSNNKKDKICIKIFLKGDVLGTMEALASEISKITHQDAEIKIVKQGLGDFTESEVLEAEAEGAVLIGFKVGAAPKAEQLISGRNITFKKYSIIYKLLDDLKENLKEILPPEIVEDDAGKAKILAIFAKSSQNMIIGGQVLDGTITKGTKFRIFREEEIIGEGKIIELQTNKQEVKQAKAPQEFGAKTVGDLIIKEDDELRSYTTREIKKTLS